MDCWRSDNYCLGGLLVSHERGDVLGYNGRLSETRPGRLVSARVCDVTDGEQMGVLWISELKRRAHVDEAISVIDDGPVRRPGKVREELAVGDLTGGLDSYIGRNLAAVTKRDIKNSAVGWKPSRGDYDAGHLKPSCDVPCECLCVKRGGGRGKTYRTPSSFRRSLIRSLKAS